MSIKNIIDSANFNFLSSSFFKGISLTFLYIKELAYIFVTTIFFEAYI